MLQREPRKASIKMAKVLKSFCSWASTPDVARLKVNPVASFKLPKYTNQQEEPTVISPTHLTLLFAALERKDLSLPRYDLLSRLMLQTGLRTGEAFAIRKQDVQDDRLRVHATLTLKYGIKESTKTNRPRWVPLNILAKQIIGELVSSDSEFLFPYNRHTYNNFFRRRTMPLVAAGIFPTLYRPYDLRHTFITRALEAGVSVAQVARWCGNSSQVIFQHYAGVSEEAEMPVL
jgi:integrase